MCVRKSVFKEKEREYRCSKQPLFHNDVIIPHDDIVQALNTIQLQNIRRR